MKETKIRLCDAGKKGELYIIPMDYIYLPRYIKHNSKLYKKWGFSMTLDHPKDYIDYLETELDIKTMKEIKGVKG